MTPKDKTGSCDIPKTTGRRPGRPAIITSARQKQERSRQSARECRTRKNLRYQYLEQLVTIKEKSVFKLRHELERHRQWCANLDQGVIPEDLVQMLKLTEDGTESCWATVPSTQPSSSTIQSVSNAANQHNWTTVALIQPNSSTIQSVSNATKQPNDTSTDIVESKSPTRKSKLYSLLTGAEASDIHSFKALHVKNSTDIASSSFKRDAEYAQTQLPNISSVTDEQKTSDADIIDWIFQNDSMCSGFQNNKTRLDQIVTKTNMERTIEISRAQIISQHPDFRVDLPDENAFTDILSGTVDNTVSSETYIGSALFAIRDKHLGTTESYPSQNVCQTGLDIQNVVQSSNNLPAEYLSTQVAVPTLLNSEQMSIHTDIFKTPFTQQFENNIHQDVSTIGIRRRAGSIGSIDSHRPGFHSSNTSDRGTSEQDIQGVCSIGDTVFSGQCNAAAGFQEYNYVDNSTANTAINIQTCPNSRGVTTIACTSKTYNVIGSNPRPQRSLTDSSKNRYCFQHSGNILNTNSSGIQLQRSCSVQENSGSSTESDKFPFLFSLLKPDKGNM